MADGDLTTDAVPQSLNEKSSSKENEKSENMKDKKDMKNQEWKGDSQVVDVISQLVDKIDDDDDFRKLRYLSRVLLTRKEGSEVKHCASLFEVLKKKLSQNDVNFFILELLYTIQRFDLLKVGGWCKHNFKNCATRNLVREKLEVKNWKKWKEIYDVVESLDPEDVESFKEKLPPLLTREKEKRDQDYMLNCLEDLVGHSMMRELEIEIQELDNHPYPMDNSPCGICMIINNKFFSNPAEMPNRLGTEVDRDALEKVFTEFDFIVEIHNNKTSVEIKQLVTELSERDHSKYNCVVVCILSHGEEGMVIGTDCKKLHIQKEIVSVFHSRQKTKCTLISKPKLFFIQACQGTNRMKAIREPIESDSPAMPMTIPVSIPTDTNDVYSDGNSSVPDTSDDLICSATYMGHLAYRSPREGSWFISTLVRQLELHGTKKDIIDIMTIVNKLVAEAEGEISGHKVKQQPTQSSSLRRKLFFKKKVK